MENQNPIQKEPDPVQPAAPPPLRLKPLIQPSDAFIQEMAAKASEPKPSIPPAVPVNVATPYPPVNSNTPAVPVQKPAGLDPNSIYPDASNDYHTQLDDKIDANLKASTGVLNFANGFEVGGSVFWYELLVGIVFYLINELVFYLFKTRITVLLAVDAVVYILAGIVTIYVAKSVLDTRDYKPSLWLAILGDIVNGFLVAILFIVVEILLLEMIFKTSIIFMLRLGGAGQLIVGILITIGMFILGYFITKLAYGLVFMLAGIVNNQTIVKIIGITALSLAVALTAFVDIHTYVTLHNLQNKVNYYSTASTLKSDASPSTYTNKVFAGHDFEVMLKFDPNATSGVVYTPTGGGNSTFDTATDELDVTGVLLNTSTRATIEFINLGTGSSAISGINPAACLSSSDTSATNEGTVLMFNAQVMGKSYAVCKFNNGTESASIYIEGNNSNWYMVNILSPAVIATNSVALLQPVVNSIVIN